MTERDDDALDRASLNFSDAPVPQHTASGEDETPNRDATRIPLRRRVLPGNPGTASGSKDNASRGTRASASGKARESRPLPPIPAKGFAPDIERMYEALSLAVTPFDTALGAALHECAPEAAKAWDELARKNHAVRRFIVALLQTSAWGNVMAAHAPLFGLAFARMAGNAPRESMMGLFLGQQAEDFLQQNGTDNGQSAA